MSERVDNLVTMLDTYCSDGGFHLNVNVFSKETIKEAYEHPELYGDMTIRVSGYCVAWGKLTDEQRRDIYTRTLHESM